MNPRLTPEKTYENNLVLLREHLNVLTDRSRPVMEVTFDGRHLFNDEHVTANPKIQVRLWDENPVMLKTDTLGMRMFLAYPCEVEGCALEPVYFSHDDVMWTAATDTSDFKILFAPNDLAEGRYRFRVEGADASGNTSDDAPYEIYFRVENEESLVVSRAYPNPFLLETSLELTITGQGQAPHLYTFFVMSMNGSLIAKSADNGTGLHVGRNFIRWDGRDTNGELVPDGMYFYRLVITGNGKDEEYNGKVVLLR